LLLARHGSMLLVLLVLLLLVQLLLVQWLH
jgi:hypothetical protein